MADGGLNDVELPSDVDSDIALLPPSPPPKKTSPKRTYKRPAAAATTIKKKKKTRPQRAGTEDLIYIVVPVGVVLDSTRGDMIASIHGEPSMPMWLLKEIDQLDPCQRLTPNHFMEIFSPPRIVPVVQQLELRAEYSIDKSTGFNLAKKEDGVGRMSAKGKSRSRVRPGAKSEIKNRGP